MYNIWVLIDQLGGLNTKYNLADKRTIDTLLRESGFSFKKSLGQNFLTDASVCPEMAAAAADANTGVLEIGPGIGVLTAELAEQAKKVVAIELDERLKPVLQKTLADYSNVQLCFGDVLKLDLHALITKEFADCARVTVCANLPYYITSPIIMLLLESRLPVERITVMVQQEAAERFCAPIPSREVGAITLSAAYYAESSVLFPVGRESFTPSPNVDSAVMQMHVRTAPPVQLENEKLFFALIKSAFLHRRKTLVNSVSAAGQIAKPLLLEALRALDISESIRAEALSLEQFAAIGNWLYNQKLL